MRADQTGIVVARGVGLGLIVMSATSAAGNIQFFEPVVTSGWTSYSPMTTSTTRSILHDSYFLIASLWLPCAAQFVLGSALILFSKPVGR